MVRNKKRPKKRYSSHSSTSKTRLAGSHTASGNPADSNIAVISPELQTTSQGQLGFPDTVYLLASVIFQNNHLERPAAVQLVNYGKERRLPLPEVNNEELHRRAYELAFNTLKYQNLLEDIMIDSCFYLSQPVPDDQMSLVAVMLRDLQDREFLPRARQGKEGNIQEVRDVENHLLRLKTKLAASLARYRIKHKIWSVDLILPETVRTKQERSTGLPLYAWVNTLRSSLDEVQCVLKSAGFSQVKLTGQLEGQTFCQDRHCGDTLVLPAQLRDRLHSAKLLGSHKLIIQDKSCSLGPNAVCSVLPEEGDVLMVGCFSGLTVSHTASLIAEKYKANANDLPTVYACVSDRTNTQREELQQTVTAMGCKNVKLISEDFQSLHCGDKRLQRVRVILLTPMCSVSALCNPLDFILQENGDTNLLRDLSQGSVSKSKLEGLVARQRKDIDHALKFPKVLAVVYSTCSSYPEENEEVVHRALERAKACPEKDEEPEQADFRLSPAPFTSPELSEWPFFTLEPSKENNGCFLAVLTREPEPVVKEAPHKAPLMESAKVILDKTGSKHQPTRIDRHGHTKQRTKQTVARFSQSRLSFSIQSKNQETKGSNSPSVCGRQRQSSQGKTKAPCFEDSKNTLSHYFSSPKQESIISISPKKSINPAVKMRNSSSNLHTAPPPPPPPPIPVSPAVRPCRAHHQEVLKPVVLDLPPVNFPNFFPPQPGRTQVRPSFSINDKWRSPNPTVPLYRSSLAKDAVDKSRRLFLSSQTPTQINPCKINLSAMCSPKLVSITYK